MKDAVKDQYNRMISYLVARGDILGINRHGSLHMKGHSNVWYVYPYRKTRAITNKDDPDSKRIRLFWKFMKGERRIFPYFYAIYLRAIRQVLWITKTGGSFEIAVVPKSDPDAPDPVAGICAEIASKEKFILGRALDGTDLLRRVKKIQPVHQGGFHSEKEHEETMEVTRKPKAGTVILADDLVFTGKTIEACKTLLKKAGVKRVYAICLYGYKQRRD